MTLERIATKVDRWQTRLYQLQNKQIRLKRLLDDTKVKIARVEAKIAKNEPYKRYYEREGK